MPLPVAPVNTTVSINPLQVEPLGRELYQMLEQNNIRAADVLGRLTPLLQDTDHVTILSRINHNVEAYDFEAAQMELRRLFEDMEVAIAG